VCRRWAKSRTWNGFGQAPNDEYVIEGEPGRDGGYSGSPIGDDRQEATAGAKASTTAEARASARGRGKGEGDKQIPCGDDSQRATADAKAGATAATN
jgi:hypothetical protein